MPFVTGITRKQKKAWFDAIKALATVKIALYSTTTNLDANQDPATPLAYGVAGELTASGTGYVAGGYAIASANMSVNADAAAYNLTFPNIEIASGTIASGTYGAMIYNTADSNNAIAVCQVNVTVGSSGTTMTITVPANALRIA